MLVRCGRILPHQPEHLGAALHGARKKGIHTNIDVPGGVTDVEDFFVSLDILDGEVRRHVQIASSVISTDSH
jgi:hypothetical protein